MRNTILTLSAFLFVAFAFATDGNDDKSKDKNETSKTSTTATSYVAKRSQLRGPAYKNLKHFRKANVKAPAKKVQLMGPEYKNQKKAYYDVEDYKVDKKTNSRKGLTGPAYKNYKPWRK